MAQQPQGCKEGGKTNRSNETHLAKEPSRVKVRDGPAGCPPAELFLKSHKWPQPEWPSLKCWGKLSSTEWWRVKGQWRTGGIFQCARKKKGYLGRVSSLYRSQSNTKNVSLEQAFKHPPKLCADSSTNWKKRRDICSPCCHPPSGPISPAWSFSASSHSSSPRAASAGNHLITSPTVLQVCDRVSHADSQGWKSLSHAACCHGHCTLDMAVMRTRSLSSGPCYHIDQHVHRAALLHVAYRGDTIFIASSFVTNGASSTAHMAQWLRSSYILC